MNETLTTILARHSIRQFTDDPVCESSMEMVLAAACAAPSAKNLRPLRFIVLNKKDMAELAEGLEQKEPFLQGQWAIAVCGDTRGYQGGTGWIEDCAAAMENMQIACFSLGLGSLWFGVYKRAPKEAVCRQFLKLPEGVEVLGITVMGYAAKTKAPHEGIRKNEVLYRQWSE